MRFSIEKILNAKRNLNFTKNGKALPKWVKFENFIHKIEVVMKMSMYGMYMKNVPFVKISLKNPVEISKVVGVLEVRIVMCDVM